MYGDGRTALITFVFRYVVQYIKCLVCLFFLCQSLMTESCAHYCNILTTAQDSAAHLVVDFDTPDSLAQVYDVVTGRLLHSCALPRLPSAMRGFVAGTILCRQKCLGNGII